MTSFIKHQIVKHLSVFAKNIQPNQISVEVLRGKGELRNIVLNETVISQKLELPSWLRIKHASCNRVTVKIPWTNLKTKPVELFVDEVHVTLELCDHVEETPHKRESSGSTNYGLGDRITETMSIFINTVEIEFTSPRFRGSVMFSRLDVVSQTPKWENSTDLKNTRFSDHHTKKVMFFKTVSWNLLRIEARAVEGVEAGADGRKQPFSSPLRLITNNGRCRIAIKKSTDDGSLICGRMQTILEEVLWIVTLPQLRSAISFGKHILELIKKSSNFSTAKVQKSTNSTRTVVESERQMAPRYIAIDFNQSSNHLYIKKVDLHLYDDGSQADFPDDWKLDNAAIQLILSRVSVDIYPSHAPLWKRKDWVGYDTSNSCASECEKLVVTHMNNISSSLGELEKKRFLAIKEELRSQNIVIRINDLVLYRVSQQTSKRDSLSQMIYANKMARQTLPQHTPIFHMELASYYYLNPTSFPVPKNVMHTVIGPLNIIVDPRTIRWLVYVFENISNMVDLKNVTEESEPSDLKIELILPKIILETEVPEYDCRFPRQIVVNLCTLTAQNYFYEYNQLSETSTFPNFVGKSSEFVGNISERLVEHVKNVQNLLLLKGTTDEKFLLIKCASLAIHSEVDGNPYNFTMSNDFSLNVYIVEDRPRVLICVDSCNPIQISVDHFQFAQFNQIQGIVDRLLTQIKKDRKFFEERYSQNSDQLDILLYGMFEKVVLNLVLPPNSVPSPYERASNVGIYEMEESISSHSSLPPTTTIPNVASTASTSAIGTDSGVGNPLNAPSPNSSILSQQNAADISRPDTASDFLGTDYPPSEFSGATLDGREDLLEETASVVTSLSEDEVQLQVTYLAEGNTTATANIFDDVFRNTVPVAEEAIFAEEANVGCTQTNRYLTRVVNIFEVHLGDVNVVADAESNGNLKVRGYSSGVDVSERLKICCSDIVRSNSTFAQLSNLSSGNIPESRSLDTKARFEVDAHDGQTDIRVFAKDLEIELSDLIVSHLGPFFQIGSHEDPKLKLEVNLGNSRVHIKDQRKTNPLRLLIGEIKIEDGANR
ncbi:Chorein N-terminal domain-containing protein [Aphelenchoides besseyi]|nr:Chorein N-terminal domain-containing protein [Aphelenchoides besseyi]